MVAVFLSARSAAALDPEPLCSYPRSLTDAFNASALPDPAETEPLLMCDPTGVGEPLDFDTPIEPADARAALAASRRLASEGHPAEAVLELSAVRDAEPVVADRVALEEAALRMVAGPNGGPDARACDTWRRASESPQRSVAARARIGHVRCLLATADRHGPDALEDLRRTYPELPYGAELDLLLAGAMHAWGEDGEAGQIYRRVDLMFPGSAAARTARAAFEALRASGVELRPLTPSQRVDRAGRLVRTGPLDMAREAVAHLRAEVGLPGPLAREVARLAARMARHEGRWEDASSLLREARGLPAADPETQQAVAERLADMERAAETRTAEEVTRRIRGLTRGRRVGALPTARLFAVLRVAARGGETETLNRALTAILNRERVPPGLRMDAGILAAGTGDDELVARLFEGAARHPNFRTAAHYHRARALERLGRTDDAQAAYADVIQSDSPRLPYYAMWSRQRLRVIRAAREDAARAAVLPVACETHGPYTSVSEMSGKTGQRNTESPAAIDLEPPGGNPYGDTGRDVDPVEAAPDTAEAELEVDVAVDSVELVSLTDAQIIEQLAPIAREHGEAFPWLTRALALMRLGEREAASDELHETYLAWRDASGHGSARADLEGVLRGRAPPRHRVSGATWRARRLFPTEARQVLATLSSALGDQGLAIRFSSSFNITGAHPEAYREVVEAAATRHGVPPELLWAVMRVESVYNPRIISYAGAIGLMQIMPRTGRLIAHGQGREGFTVDELLDPATNIDMAAWYLASLIERFDGRLPLAIASYNGGPHNVRRWMRDYSSEMPLDAFLERIPFAQTHRYVRRVMTHYEAYLAARDQQVAPIDTRLPAQASADAVAF